MIFLNPLDINNGIVLLKWKAQKYGQALTVRDFKEVVKRVKLQKINQGMYKQWILAFEEPELEGKIHLFIYNTIIPPSNMHCY